jgi:hypothetical protein
VNTEGPEKAKGRLPHQDDRPLAQQPSTERNHAAPTVAASRRQLPQAQHCDLGIVDDGSEVGS